MYDNSTSQSANEVNTDLRISQSVARCDYGCPSTEEVGTLLAIYGVKMKVEFVLSK